MRSLVLTVQTDVGAGGADTGTGAVGGVFQATARTESVAHDIGWQKTPYLGKGEDRDIYSVLANTVCFI